MLMLGLSHNYALIKPVFLEYDDGLINIDVGFPDSLPEFMTSNCPKQIVDGYKMCVADGKQKWNPIKNDEKTSCCAAWQVYNCMEKNVNKCKNPEMVKAKFGFGEALISIPCKDFPRGSRVCGGTSNYIG